MKNHKRIALPKRIGWPVLAFLVFLDAFVTVSAGREGNPLWRSVVESYGINALWFLAAAVLALFYLVIKVLGWYARRFERLPQAEEIILTVLTIAFVTYDIYIIFALPYFGFLGSRSHYAVIPVLLVPVLIYSIWVEWQRRLHRNKNL